MTTKTDQNMKILNSEPKQKQDQTFYFSWTPAEQKGDDWIIKQKIEGVSMEIQIGGTTINYDSNNAAASANNPLGEFFKALVGSEFTLTLNMKRPEGHQARSAGDAFYLKKLSQANPQMSQLLSQILSEQALKEMAEPTFAAIPNKDVAKGEKWTKENTLDMGPIGKYTNTYTYTFDGTEGKLDKIKVETTLKYTPPDDKATGAGLPFKIKSADLKTTSGTGTAPFDPEKGRIEKATFKLDLSGELEIEIGGQTTKVELKQTQETTVETSDYNPAAAENASRPVAGFRVRPGARQRRRGQRPTPTGVPRLGMPVQHPPTKGVSTIRTPFVRASLQRSTRGIRPGRDNPRLVRLPADRYPRQVRSDPSSGGGAGNLARNKRAGRTRPRR